MNQIHSTQARISSIAPLPQPLKSQFQASRLKSVSSSYAPELTSGGLGSPFKAVGNWVKDVLKSFGAIFGLGNKQEKATPAKETASNNDPTHVCGAGCPIHGDEAHSHDHSTHGHGHHHHHS